MSWHTGETVKGLSAERGLSHAQLAIEVGASSSALYNYYQRQEWAPAHVTRAAKALGVNAMWLQTGEGAKFPVDDPYSTKSARVERALMLFKAQQDRALEEFVQHLLTQVRDAIETPQRPAPAVAKPKRRGAKTRR